MTDIDLTIILADLNLMPQTVTALSWCGYNTLADFEGMSHAEILRLPGMGGSQYKKVMAALGREPYPWRPKKPRGRRQSPPMTPESSEG